MSYFNMKTLFFCLLFFLLSCMQGSSPTTPTGLTDAPPPIERKFPKRPDPIKQAECNKKSRSNVCEDKKDCKDICDDVFRSRADKKDCYRLPESIVAEFEKLLEFVEDGDVQDIDPEILDCMLDIDEREFARSVKKMNRSEAKRFLVAVADDESLADVLEGEDDEFMILKQVLNKGTGSNDLIVHLTKEIDDDKSFFWLSAAGSEKAWEYFDNYVGDECDSSPPDICSSGDNIQAYCNALDDDHINKRDLEDFLTEADLFAEEYEEDVDDADYLYEVDDTPGDNYTGDFRDWCEDTVLSPNRPTPCPAAGADLPENKKIAITLVSAGGGYPLYLKNHDPFCEMQGTSQSLLDFTQTYGSSDPSNQDLILMLRDEGSEDGKIIIFDDELNYDSSRTYYLYIGSVKYNLNNPKKYTESCAGVSTTRDFVQWDDFIETGSLSISDNNVWLASDKNADDCKYHSP